MSTLDMLFRAITDGGPAAVLVLVLGLGILLVAPIVPLVFGLARWRIPASVSWIGALLIVGVGAAGSFWGVSQAMDAVQAAAPEMKQTLLAAGISIAMYTGWLATTLASATLTLCALAGALPAPIRPGPEARLDLAGVGGSLLGGLFGWMIATATVAFMLGLDGIRDVGPGLPALIALTVVVGLAVLIASIRLAGPDEKEERGRMAGLRIFVGVSGFLAIVLAGEAWTTLGMIQAFMAVAHAAAEMKQQLLAAGISIAMYSTFLGWTLALVPLFAGLGSAIPALRGVGGRQIVGAVVAVVLVGLILGATIAMRMSVLGLFSSLGL